MSNMHTALRNQTGRGCVNRVEALITRTNNCKWAARCWAAHYPTHPKIYLLAYAVRCAGINQSGLEVSNLGRIRKEEAQSSIDLALPGIIGNHTMGQTANHRVSAPITASRLQVFIEQRLIA